MMLEPLYARIKARLDQGDSTSSYTARLAEQGRERIVRKLSEESLETAMEFLRDDKEGLVRESADLLYHLAVAWAVAGVTPSMIAEELERRQKRG
ncbi:MAG: phosphoribosyl-ATP diphosphatase [Pseudomonadota bacterium]